MDQKSDSNDSILVMINRLTKMVHYKPVKVIVNILSFAKVIIDAIIMYHNLLNLVVPSQNLLFNSKFLLLLCYFLDIM